MKSYKATTVDRTVKVYVCPVCNHESQSTIEGHLRKHEFDDLKKEVKWFGNSGHFQTEEQLSTFALMYQAKWNYPFEDRYELKFEWKGAGEYMVREPVQVSEDYEGYKTFEVWFWRSR